MACARLACGNHLTIRSLSDVSLSAFVTQLEIEDMVTPHPVKSRILTFAQSSSAATATTGSASYPSSSSLSALQTGGLPDNNHYRIPHQFGPSSSSSSTASSSSPSLSSSSHKIVLFYEALPNGVSMLRAYSQPLEVVLNVVCWERLMVTLLI